MFLEFEKNISRIPKHIPANPCEACDLLYSLNKSSDIFKKVIFFKSILGQILPNHKCPIFLTKSAKIYFKKFRLKNLEIIIHFLI